MFYALAEQKNIFGGMDKEELLKYAKDPFWVRLRWFLFITFWLCWAAMLVGAIMIIYEAPKCEPPAPRTWLVNKLFILCTLQLKF